MRRTFDSWIALALGLAVYLLAGQKTFYGVDGWMLVRRVATGDVRSDMHLTYKPIARLAVVIGESLGLTVYESMVAISGVGAAVGTALVHRAATVLGADRRRAWLVAAACGLCPGVLFFATVVERHGPFLAFAGWTALASAHLARAPGPRSGAGFALACTAAYAAHSTGVLMVAAYVPLAMAWARLGVGRSQAADWRPILIGAFTASVSTAVGMFVARRIGVWVGTVEHEGDNFAFFLQHAAVHVQHPEALAACLWNEVLTPFAPMSVLWLLAFRDARPRLVGWAVVCSVAVYLLFSFLILGAFDERGAYALPLAWPLAWVTVRRLRESLVWCVVAVGAVLGVHEVVAHDDHHLAERGSGMYAVAGERTPYLIVAAWEDFELVFLYQPEARPISGYYDAFDTHAFDAEVARRGAPLLLDFLRNVVRDGKDLLMTDEGLAMLESPAEPGKAGPLVVRILEEGFDFVPVQSGGFHGFRLVPRG